MKEQNNEVKAKSFLEAEADGIIEGRNAVTEALRAGVAIDKIFIAKGETDRTLGHIASTARAAGVVVVDADRRKLDHMSRTHSHQGVIALASVREYATVDSMLAAAEQKGEKPLLVICDEVQVGNGRSGMLYGYMNYGITPDIVSTAKGLGGGLPLGATLLGEQVKDVLTPGSHGSTFGGNPVCCAGALSILERIDDKLLAEVREKSAYIKSRLEGAKGVVSVSGLGLMIGIKTERDAGEIVSECMKRGVLVIKAKDKVRLLPALNIPMEQLQSAIDTLAAVCAG